MIKFSCTSDHLNPLYWSLRPPSFSKTHHFKDLHDWPWTKLLEVGKEAGPYCCSPVFADNEGAGSLSGNGETWTSGNRVLCSFSKCAINVSQSAFSFSYGCCLLLLNLEKSDQHKNIDGQDKGLDNSNHYSFGGGVQKSWRQNRQKRWNKLLFVGTRRRT